MHLINFPFLYKTIEQLNGFNILSEISPQKLRENVSIVIIDDDVFLLEPALEKLGFRFTNKSGTSDDTNINDYVRYDLILCDIAGVATTLNSKYQGAFLAREIKKAYPEKIVISYTANSYEPSVYEYQSELDGIVPKGLGVEEWTSLLDEKIRLLVDPKEQWARYRDRLLQEHVDIRLVAKMESDYVKAVLNRSFTSFREIYEREQCFKQMVGRLMSSLMFRVLSRGI